MVCPCVCCGRVLLPQEICDPTVSTHILNKMQPAHGVSAANSPSADCTSLTLLSSADIKTFYTEKPMQRDVSHIFNKFAGREVDMTERTETHKFKHIGEQTFTVIEPANKDEPLFKEMQDEAKKNGLSLRLWW